MNALPRPLPATAQRLLHDIAAVLDVPALEVFGGAALNLLTRPGEAPSGSDIDVAIRGDRADAEAAQARLAASPHCGQPGPVRPYRVHLTRPVANFAVGWKATVLDISFMDHTNEAHFDIETVTWRFPDMTYTDPWKVTGRMVTGLRLVTSLDAENPVLLANRVLKLSAKYNLDIAADPALRKLTETIAERAAGWRPDDSFHGRYAHDAHLRHVHGALRRACDPARLLRGCLVTGLLDARLGPLADLLRRAPRHARDICAAAKRNDLAKFWSSIDMLVDALPGWRAYQPAITGGSMSPVAWNVGDDPR